MSRVVTLLPSIKFNLQFVWLGDHGSGQKLQLLEMRIKGYYYPEMRFLFLGNYLLLLSFDDILSL